MTWPTEQAREASVPVEDHPNVQEFARNMGLSAAHVADTLARLAATLQRHQEAIEAAHAAYRGRPGRPAPAWPRGATVALRRRGPAMSEDCRFRLLEPTGA